jgi:hypothetical protein
VSKFFDQNFVYILISPIVATFVANFIHPDFIAFIFSSYRWKIHRVSHEAGAVSELYYLSDTEKWRAGKVTANHVLHVLECCHVDKTAKGDVYPE